MPASENDMQALQPYGQLGLSFLAHLQFNPTSKFYLEFLLHIEGIFFNNSPARCLSHSSSFYPLSFFPTLLPFLGFVLFFFLLFQFLMLSLNLLESFVFWICQKQIEEDPLASVWPDWIRGQLGVKKTTGPFTFDCPENRAARVLVQSA